MAVPRCRRDAGFGALNDSLVHPEVVEFIPAVVAEFEALCGGDVAGRVTREGIVDVLRGVQIQPELASGCVPDDGNLKSVARPARDVLLGDLRGVRPIIYARENLAVTPVAVEEPPGRPEEPEVIAVTELEVERPNRRDDTDVSRPRND